MSAGGKSREDRGLDAATTAVLPIGFRTASWAAHPAARRAGLALVVDDVAEPSSSHDLASRVTAARRRRREHLETMDDRR